MSRRKTNMQWKNAFCTLLKNLFLLYDVNCEDFCNIYTWSVSTVQYWVSGRNLPCSEALEHLVCYFSNLSEHNQSKDKQLYQLLNKVFVDNQAESTLLTLCSMFSNDHLLLREVLQSLFKLAKNNRLDWLENRNPQPSGKTRAVVFDFDGTLTSNHSNRTTWETIWTRLGYNVKECQKLHQRFDRNEITHEQWCKITEDRFREKGLTRDLIKEIAQNISLIDGAEETFIELDNLNIKIYIVSGSISEIIRIVLNDLCKYVEEIKANTFLFDRAGVLNRIVGTKYDFEGKAEYIKQISASLGISSSDIVFIGNSVNDRFAYSSGAKTLCINPILTDTTNQKVWNICIQTCNTLTEILNII